MRAFDPVPMVMGLRLGQNHSGISGKLADNLLLIMNIAYDSNDNFIKFQRVLKVA